MKLLLRKLKRLTTNRVKGKKKVAVIGFGPAGMFAALRLIELASNQ